MQNVNLTFFHDDSKSAFVKLRYPRSIYSVFAVEYVLSPLYIRTVYVPHITLHEYHRIIM